MVRAFAIFHYFSNFNLTLQTYTISQLDCIPNSSRACLQGHATRGNNNNKRRKKIDIFHSNTFLMKEMCN
jgi:hypothetical protein